MISPLIFLAIGASARYINSTAGIAGPYGLISPNIAASIIAADACTTIFDVSCYQSCSNFDPDYLVHVTQYQQTAYRARLYSTLPALEFNTTTTSTGCTNTTSTSADVLTFQQDCTAKGPAPSYTSVICTNTYILDTASTTLTATATDPAHVSQATFPVTAGASLLPSVTSKCAAATTEASPYPTSTTTECGEEAYRMLWSEGKQGIGRQDVERLREVGRLANV